MTVKFIQIACFLAFLSINLAYFIGKIEPDILNNIVSIVQLSNGNLVIATSSGMAQSAIFIKNSKTGKILKKFNLPNGYIASLAVLKNGHFAIGYNEKTLIIVNNINGSVVKNLTNHNGKVSSLVLLENGCLASLDSDTWKSSSYIFIYNVSESYSYSIRTIPLGSFSSVLVLTNDGYLASGSFDSTIKIWDPLNGTLIRTIIGNHSVIHLQVLENGNLASGSDNVISIWNPKNGNLISHFKASVNSINSLAALPNGLLATSIFIKQRDNDRVKIWDSNSGLLIKEIRRPICSHILFKLKIKNFKDPYLVCGLLITGFEIKIWNPMSGHVISLPSHHSFQIKSLALFKNGILASGSDDGRIKLWNSKYGTLIKTLTGHNQRVSSLLVLPNGNLASSSYDSTIKIWNIYKGISIRNLTGHTRDVYCLDLLQNGNIASGSVDSSIRIWNPNNGDLLKTIVDSERGIIYAVKGLKNGNIAVGSGEYFNFINIYNALNGSLVLKIAAQHLNTISFIESLGNNRIASAGGGKIKIWNESSGELVTEISVSSNYISSIRLLQNGNFASASYDGNIKIWNVNNGTLLKTLTDKDSITSLIVLANGNFVTSGSEGQIIFWKRLIL